ncbi:MAG: ATP-binding cassette domain-containing protein, partial [Sphingobacteriia bacterium]
MALIVDTLRKTYGSQQALDGVSFRMEKGEIVGFLGPNGAGKSTTMKIITGFIQPTAGTAQLDGLEAGSLEMRRRIGYLPEHNPLYLDMYVHEFLRFTGRLYGLRGAQLGQRIAELIAQTGLQHEQHKKIGALSRGYRQRVGIAQALIHDPELLILDEPTSGLDPNQVIEIRNLIKEVGRTKTVLFSSHILPEVEAVAQRVI